MLNSPGASTDERSGLWFIWLFASLSIGAALLADERDELFRGAEALLFFVVIPCGAVLWMWRRVYQNYSRPVRPRLTLFQGLALMLCSGVEVGLLVETAQSRGLTWASAGAAFYPMALMIVYIVWEPVLHKVKTVQRRPRFK